MAEDELQQQQNKWKVFFKELQSLPVARDLTDEDIARKIDAYRNENIYTETEPEPVIHQVENLSLNEMQGRRSAPK